MLRWQVPVQFHGGGANLGRYLMNQHTFGLVLTMSDAMGRPIMQSRDNAARPLQRWVLYPVQI